MSDKRTTPSEMRALFLEAAASGKANELAQVEAAIYAVGAELLAEWQETNRLLALIAERMPCPPDGGKRWL